MREILARKQPSIVPSNQNPQGALPARFRRPRLLIIGCGDVGMRVARDAFARGGTSKGIKLMALNRSADKITSLRQQGVQPLYGDLDAAKTLSRFAGLATHVLYLAPPAAESSEDQAWWRDRRMERMVQALSRRSLPASFVYASTSGVYGDCRGQWISETRSVAPATPRGQRRANAERVVRGWGSASGTRTSVLRIPGIYALDREGGTPIARLQKGSPVLQAEDDVFTNHIHADDLASICAAALWRGKPQRIYHASDDSELRMGDYFDMAASIFSMPKPPRVSREQAQALLPSTVLSFMSESRRMRNDRMKKELRVALRYPTVSEGLRGRPLR